MSASQDVVSRLQAHLQILEADPAAPLNERLLQECETFVIPQLIQDQAALVALVSRVATVTLQLQQDPTPMTKLLQKLSEPFSFSDILQLQPGVDFVAGLDVNAYPYNNLMLSLVEKAASNPTDAAQLARKPNLVQAIVKLWLTSPDVGVADKASSVLISLLTVDMESEPVGEHGIGDGAGIHSGAGLIWRRLFADKDVYSMLFAVPSFRSPIEVGLSRKEKTIAQARLLAWLPKVARLDWDYVARSHHPDIETSYGLNPSSEGLLDFAFVHMADYKDDVLMHINVIQSLTDLLQHAVAPSAQNLSMSKSLEFSVSRGLHHQFTSVWLDPESSSLDPVDMSFLYGPCANYYASFTSLFPAAFLSSAEDAKKGLLRLAKTTDISANQWAHGNSPQHDLHVLVSLPRVALLPQRYIGQTLRSSPLLQIPCKVTNADALRTLATVFGGPQKQHQIITFPITSMPEGNVSELSSADKAEASSARALYCLYLHYHSDLFTDLVSHAATVAIPDKALAAIDLISSIASATWAPLPAEDHFDDHMPPPKQDALPSEMRLQSMLPRGANLPLPTAESGIRALFQSPARESVFPFLMRPPQSFSHLIGGRGDPESSAYKIAMAKWELVQQVHSKLKEVDEMTPNQGFRSVVEALEGRMRDGIWGRSSDIGGRISTLEL